MELDPHQLIEGCLIAYSWASQCFLYIRGEMAVAQEGRPGAQRCLRSWLRG